MEPIWLRSVYADLQMFSTCWVMFKWQSSVTPRFFTEETKSTSEFPVRIEEGRGKLTDSLCDLTSIDSVLLSFN